MDNLTKAIYKRNRICKICGNYYGSDKEVDNGNCPICIQKYADKKSRLSNNPERRKKQK